MYTLAMPLIEITAHDKLTQRLRIVLEIILLKSISAIPMKNFPPLRLNAHAELREIFGEALRHGCIERPSFTIT